MKPENRVLKRRISRRLKTAYPGFSGIGTCNRKISSIRGFMRYLSSYGYVQVSLPLALSNLKQPRRLPGSVLSHMQMKKLLNSIPLHTPLGYRNRAMLELLYTAGIRAAEILGLSLEDVDFQHHTARVIGKGDKERVVPIGKTANMLFPISPEWLIVLCKWRVRYA